jgi:hypothetical protein
MRTMHCAELLEELYAELHDEPAEERMEEQDLVEDDDDSDPWTYLSESVRCSSR